MKSTYHDTLPSYQSGDVCNVRLVAQSGRSVDPLKITFMV